MEISIHISQVHIDIPDKMSKVQSDKFGKEAAKTWKKIQDPYVPMRSGNLANNTVLIKPWALWHNIVYAHYQYVNDRFNHHFPGLQVHPKATAHWDQKAWEEHGDEFIAAMQKYVDSGALGLGSK